MCVKPWPHLKKGAKKNSFKGTLCSRVNKNEVIREGKKIIA